MEYKKKISFCIIVKNEERNLNRVLKSIKPMVDRHIGEIIVVDTGSTDNSVSIAKNYTDKVFEYEWTGGFGDMRNKSISHAEGEWIFIIDADEEIDNYENMISLLNMDLSKYNSISIKIKNFINSNTEGNDARYNIGTLIRGFRNDESFKYKGAIHEQPQYKLPTYKSEIILNHYGYIWKEKEFIDKKFKRNQEILEAELKKDPKNIYYQFQLAANWGIKDINKALIEMRIAYELINKLSHKNKAKYLYIYGIYAKLAYNSEKYNETIKICNEGLGINKDYIDLLYFSGISYLKLNEYENAIRSFKNYLECRENLKNASIYNDPAFVFYSVHEEFKQSVLEKIALIYIKNNEFNKALEYGEQLVASETKNRIILSIAKKGNLEHILNKYFIEIFDNRVMEEDFIAKFENAELGHEVKSKFSNTVIGLYGNSDRKKENYYILNLIRKELNENKYNEESYKYISLINNQYIENYYGDLIIYIIKNKLAFENFEYFGNVENISTMFKYIIKNYEDEKTYIEMINYLFENKDNENYRYWIAVARGILLSNRINDEIFSNLFKVYIDKGIKYIKMVYNPEIFENEKYENVMHDEHRFFIYLDKAISLKNDSKKYIEYLRKALRTYPMEKGIELLMNEANNTNKNDDVSNYINIVKDNINKLIEMEKLEEAKALINKYLEVFSEDLEVLMVKSEIQVKLILERN